MRIALYHNLPSGGGKRALYEIVCHLAARHEIDVYTLSTANHDFADLRPYVASHFTYDFQPLRLFSSPFGRLNQLQRRRDLGRLDLLNRQIAAEIDAREYDVVMVHPCQFTQAPSVLMYLQTPTVYYAHEGLRRLYEPGIPGRHVAQDGYRNKLDKIDPLIAFYDNALRLVDRQAILAATRVLVNSRFTQANICRDYGLEPQVSYLGVDTAKFCPDSAPERDNFLLSVGALRPNKGCDFLIEAIALIPEIVRPPLRIIANSGDSGEQAYLEGLAAALGVKIEISLGVADDFLVYSYRNARLVIYAPHLEPFGFVPLEAMACGTPIVAVAEGGVLETMINGQTGLLVARDANQFAEAVMWLLNNPQMLEAYGEQGRRQVLEHWSWEAATEQLEKHLVEVANAGQETSP